MVSCTFDSTTVPSRHILREMMIGTAGAYAYECEIECRTETYTDYTALAAKTGYITKTTMLSGKTSVQTIGGTKGTLVLNGITYTNCYIENLSNAEVTDSNLGVWSFTIGFVRETI
jgi:hypothetical protein